MKHSIPETESGSTETKRSIPPPPPVPRFKNQKNVTMSVTNREIAKFWRKKRIEEEEHFLAAVKAAARLRARNLKTLILSGSLGQETNSLVKRGSKEDDYKLFLESLENDDDNKENKMTEADGSKDQKNKEVRVGIKDWWTKSKYAYLNQPAISSDNPPKKRASNYAPYYFSFKPTPLYPTSLGVF